MKDRHVGHRTSCQGQSLGSPGQEDSGGRTMPLAQCALFLTTFCSDSAMMMSRARKELR